jgi:hypothetical protein
MTEFDRTRRRFLASTALTGLGLLAGVGAARAFTPQPMTAEEHKAYRNACSAAADPYHAQLVQQAEAELGGRMSAAEIEQAVAALRCPICGCPLVAAAPPPGAAKAG